MLSVLALFLEAPMNGLEGWSLSINPVISMDKGGMPISLIYKLTSHVH